MKLYKIIASGFGTGYAPVAPGTAGSILGIIIFYFFNGFLHDLQISSRFVYMLNCVVIILIVFIGVRSIKKVHAVWEHDASKIVIDEIAGVWIAAYAVPFKWQYYLYALILFRLFDITKPLFIRKIDKMQGDWSVMLDDVLAGIYASFVIQLIILFKIFV